MQVELHWVTGWITLSLHMHPHNWCWTKNLALFTPDIKLNTFAFILFALFGTKNRAYGSSIVLQILPHLLTLTVNG